ncbi:xylulokinase [Lacticaseibacillus jixiensis]|uniref:xylulokinase n=1 Tax=Lacticaseibacillus jixiensis TaxID=3231926 RepID=UPI0036F2F584
MPDWQATSLGIELGSTQIKCVLIDASGQVLAVGVHQWTNRLEAGLWTYALADVWTGLQDAYAQLAAAVAVRFNQPLTTIGSIGVSAMMHGYLAFDAAGKLLVPFRTWRNNNTLPAAAALSKLFGVNIPARWSIAHLHQAVLDHEPHLADLAYMTTLAGYVHWQLTGQRVLGLGDASGMFPIDSTQQTYRADLLAAYSALPAVAQYSWRIADLLPKPLAAGVVAGRLSAAGARLLDPSGVLAAGCVLAPPEGDAGTGMVATNAVRPGSGNVSVGTSAFAMVVLNQPLKANVADVDLVTTPAGAPVAMVHANNCTSELNAWLGLFETVATTLGATVTPDELYGKMLRASLQAEPGAGGLLCYANLSGENITAVQAGRPLLVRGPHAQLTLGNFMLAQLYAAYAPLAIGYQRLQQAESLQVTHLIAQGGLLKTPQIAQQALADALQVPVAVMTTAAAGGPYGMALLAQYTASGATKPLADWLDDLFAQAPVSEMAPTPAGMASFEQFSHAYAAALPLAQAAGAVVQDR